MTTPIAATAQGGDLAARVAELEARLAVDRAEHEAVHGQACEILARVVAVNARVIAALVEFTEAFEVPAETEDPPSACHTACRPARWFLRLRGGGA